MDLSVILTIILVIAVLYLHLKRDPIIFHRDVRTAKKLIIVLLVLNALSSVSLTISGDLAVLFMLLGPLSNAACWVLIIVSVWKIAAAFYKEQYFCRDQAADADLRRRVKAALQDTIDAGKPAESVKLFISGSFSDPGLEEIRKECESVLGFEGIYEDGKLKAKYAEKLNALLQKLNEE